MNITLVNFEKKDMAFPKPLKPWFKEAIFDRKVMTAADLSSVGHKEKVYELLQIGTKDKDGKQRLDFYYVNKEDAQLAFPILKAIVANETEELRVQHERDFEAWVKLNRELERIKGFWFNKAWDWLVQKVKDFH